MLALILARALQGLGGGGLIALAQTIIGDLVPPRERARYQVHIAGVFMTSSLVGPVLGGFFAEHLHWSVIFWINLPLGLAALAISNRALKKLPRYDRPHELDLVGAAFLVAATVSLLLALGWGGTVYPWRSAPILGLVALSAMLWALFAWRMRTAREPLIPAGVLNNPVVRMATLATSFGMGTYIGLTIYLPVYFEAVLHLSASASGLALIPLMAGTVTGATLSGRAMMRFERYKRLPTAGLCIAVLGMSVLALAAGRLPLVAIEIVLGLLSVGLGTLLPVATVSIQNAVAPHQLGTATGTANFFRSLGSAFVVAIFGAIVLGASGLGSSLRGLDNLAAAAAQSGIDLSAVFRWVFAAATMGFLLALLFLWRMEERPLRGSAPPAKASSE
jgi:predicted MFS family arabinose efflux permease